MGPRRRGDTSFSKRIRAKKSYVAGGIGFEPRQAESESAVLPLDDPPGSKTAGLCPAGPSNYRLSVMRTRVGPDAPSLADLGPFQHSPKRGQEGERVEILQAAGEAFLI